TLLSKVPHYSRMNLISTTAACMTVQHGAKVIVFGTAGFLFAPWAPFLILSLGASFLGTALGAKILKRLDEQFFRQALKWVLTALAVYLMGLALLSILSGSGEF
ncbi:MAG: hypothetical protein AAF603_11845, partial [Pseudomonadota bacterium]